MDKISFTEEQADIYFEFFLAEYLDEITEHKIFSYLGKYTSNDLAYKYLKYMIENVIFKYHVGYLASKLTIEQAEDLTLLLIEKFQNKNFPDGFAKILENLITKLPNEKIKIYQKKLLEVKNNIPVAQFLISKFSDSLSNDIIKTLINTLLNEIKNNDENHFIFQNNQGHYQHRVIENFEKNINLLSENRSHFTDDQIINYYEYLLTFATASPGLVTNHEKLIGSLINRFTVEQLKVLYDFKLFPTGMTGYYFCFRNIINLCGHRINHEKLLAIYSGEFKKAQEGEEISTKGSFTSNLIFVDQLRDLVTKFINSNQLEIIDEEKYISDLQDERLSKKSRR